jgi:hypothetical protein
VQQAVAGGEEPPGITPELAGIVLLAVTFTIRAA